MRGYRFFMGCQQNSEHLITVPRPGGGWSIPFSPSHLKWLEEELRQQRGDEWTWGNCPNQVEWFPNGKKRHGWTSRKMDGQVYRHDDRRSIPSPQSPLQSRQWGSVQPHWTRYGEMNGLPLTTVNTRSWMEWQEARALESAKKQRGDCCE